MVCATIGGIFLYKSYAYYEEDKEYNVIKGVIPDFSDTDIELAFTINNSQENTTFPAKGSNYVGESVSCKNGVTAEWDNTNWTLKNIKNVKAGNPARIKCTVNFKTGINLSNSVQAGNYVKMTPKLQKYVVSKSLTGHTSDQMIKPSELDTWRVLRKNSNNTIDLISEYVSSTGFIISGGAGYRFYIETLNTVAKAYENEEYTVGSRYPGYVNQTGLILDGIKGSTFCGTTGESGWSSGWESIGGGDTAYTTDLNLIQSALGTKVANDKGTNSVGEYWFGSRYFSCPNTSDKYFTGRIITNTGRDTHTYLWRSKGEQSFAPAYKLRPIVTLKANALASSGDGSQNNPYVLN